MKNENTYTSIPSFCIRSTPFGPAALLWSVINDRPRISRVFLTKPVYSAYDHVSVLFPDSNIFSCSEIEVVANDLPPKNLSNYYVSIREENLQKEAVRKVCQINLIGNR